MKEIIKTFERIIQSAFDKENYDTAIPLNANKIWNEYLEKEAKYILKYLFSECSEFSEYLMTRGMLEYSNSLYFISDEEIEKESKEYFGDKKTLSIIWRGGFITGAKRMRDGFKQKTINKDCRPAFELDNSVMKTTKELTTKEKYDYLIGMIEGCMNNDEDIVATEKLLESLLIDLKVKYPVFSCTDSTVEFKRYKKLLENFGNQS